MADRIEIEANGEKIQATEGARLLDALLGAGVRQMHVCGGRGLCTTCRVAVEDGAENLSPMEAKERVSLRAHLSFAGDVRLACQARVLGPVRVRSLLPRMGTLPG